MKRSFALLLILMLIAVIPIASAEVDWKNPPAGYYLTPADYPDTDLSKPYEIQMFSSSGALDNEEATLAEINRVLEERGFNTSIRLIHVNSSAGANLYTMTLASGEPADVYFTAPWQYMWTEAAKESWMVLEPEFIEKYMPMTWKTQKPESWSETTYNGQIIAVPGNYAPTNPKIAGVRKDLMTKYGFETLNSWDEFKRFLLTIAEKETPESGIFAYNACYRATPDEMWRMYLQQKNLYPLYNEQWLFECKGSDVLPEYSDVKLFYETDFYREYCREMVELRKAGVWSQSALANTVDANTAYQNGTSATCVHNYTVYSYSQTAEENNPGTEYEIVDLFPDAFCIAECYSNNDLAIPYSCEEPERAAMIIDLLKNDFQIRSLARFGIEGIDWVDNGDQTYTTTESHSKAHLGSIGWALQVDWNYDSKPATAYEQRMNAHSKADQSRLVPNPCVSFVFDTEPVKAQLAACQSLLQEYTPVLNLGFSDDVDAYLDELITKLYASGLQEINDEMGRQYNAWKASR